MYLPKGIRQTIQRELDRQGLHAKPRQIVEALAGYGIQIDESAVQRVRFEMQKQGEGVRQFKLQRRHAVKTRRRPQKVRKPR